MSLLTLLYQILHQNHLSLPSFWTDSCLIMIHCLCRVPVMTILKTTAPSVWSVCATCVTHWFYLAGTSACATRVLTLYGTRPTTVPFVGLPSGPCSRYGPCKRQSPYCLQYLKRYDQVYWLKTEREGGREVENNVRSPVICWHVAF